MLFICQLNNTAFWIQCQQVFRLSYRFRIMIAKTDPRNYNIRSKQREVVTCLQHAQDIPEG